MAKKRKNAAQEVFGDILRRVSFNGIGERKLPKELMSAAVSNIEKMRQGVLDVISTEFNKTLTKIDFNRVLKDISQNYTLKLSAEIQLEPKNKKKKREESN